MHVHLMLMWGVGCGLRFTQDTVMHLFCGSVDVLLVVVVVVVGRVDVFRGNAKKQKTK